MVLLPPLLWMWHRELEMRAAHVAAVASEAAASAMVLENILLCFLAQMGNPSLHNET